MRTRAVYQPQSAERNISGAYVCHQRGIAVYQQQSKTVSQSAAVYQQRGTSTAINKAEANLAQLYISSHQKLISSHQKLNAKPFWTTQLCDQSGISIVISSKKHIWRRCMSPAGDSCMSTAIKNLKRSRSGRHSRVDQSVAV